MKKQWETKEKNDSKTFTARRTPRSGGLWYAKGDSKSAAFLIENKTTKNGSYSIKEVVWRKIEREALLESRIPLLSVEFGKADKKCELVIMSKDDFEAWKQL